MAEVEQEIDANTELQGIVNAIAGGDNVAAKASFNQVMDTKREAGFAAKKAELQANIFGKHGIEHLEEPETVEPFMSTDETEVEEPAQEE